MNFLTKSYPIAVSKLCFCAIKAVLSFCQSKTFEGSKRHLSIAFTPPSYVNIFQITESQQFTNLTRIEYLRPRYFYFKTSALSLGFNREIF